VLAPVDHAYPLLTDQYNVYYIKTNKSTIISVIKWSDEVVNNSDMITFLLFKNNYANKVIFNIINDTSHFT
jgi:hypothetical protein